MKRFLPVFAFAAVTAASPAQVWNEVGDAGDLIGSSQETQGIGALTTIHGELDDDIDIFTINVTNSATFRIETINSGLDTMLYMFNDAGQGVVADDDSGSGVLSLISMANVPFVTGIMHIAIGSFFSNPWIDQPNGFMWDQVSPVNQGPNANGANNPLHHWELTGPGAGSYTMVLEGVEFATVPEPATFVAIGLGLAGIAVARRRK